mgnify:CR=1 FL=1
MAARDGAQGMDKHEEGEAVGKGDLEEGGEAAVLVEDCDGGGGSQSAVIDKQTGANELHAGQIFFWLFKLVVMKKQTCEILSSSQKHT